jgi:hypothetical protein
VIRSEATKGVLEARSLLLAGVDEARGYGLYTYLLLGARGATTEHKRRQFLALEALLRLDDVYALEKYTKVKSGINIVYVPIKNLPPDGMLAPISDKEYSELAEWIAGRYDYERASVLLHRLESKGIDPNGIYLVSDLAPLTSADASSTKVFVQNFTTKPPDYIYAHVQIHMRRATQEGRWTMVELENLFLDIRSWMATAAKGYTDVKGQLDQTLEWTTKRK